MWPGEVIGFPQIRQEYSILSLGLWPCSLPHFPLHVVVCDVGPEESAPDDKPEGPAADDKLEGPAPDNNPGGPGADDKFDKLMPIVGDAVEPARVPVVSFLFCVCA